MIAPTREARPTAVGRPPGPPERRGVLDSARYYYNFLVDSVGFVEKRFERYGDIYYAPSNGVGLYVLRHPDHLWEVLVRDGAKYGKTHSAFDVLSQVLGHGLLIADGADWRRQRRLVQPAFAPRRLEGYADMMADEAEKTLARWHPGQVRELGREMMELTLRIVCRTLFSHDVRGQTDEVWRAMQSFRDDLMAPSLFPSWLPLPSRRRAEAAVATLDRIIYGMIAERRSGRRVEPADLLQMLLDAQDDEGGGGLTDREVRDQLVTLFLAGHETTSHALSWSWYLLSQSREPAERLRVELRSELGGRAPRLSDLERLPYTRKVFEEAMRLYPPAYTVARRAEQDATIGGYEVPAGSEVIIWILRTHRDPRWYPEPNRFDPDRFSAEAAAARPKCAYLPFGAGARACIGKVFALIEGQIVLATVAQRFDLALDPPDRDVRWHPRVTLAPKGRMPMVLRAATNHA